MKRSYNFNSDFSNKRLCAWQSFFGLQHQPQYNFISPVNSAWHYLKKKTKVVIIDSYYDHMLQNKQFESVQEAASFFGCQYFYIHLAIKKDMYLKGEYKLRYIN